MPIHTLRHPVRTGGREEERKKDASAWFGVFNDGHMTKTLLIGSKQGNPTLSEPVREEPDWPMTETFCMGFQTKNLQQ
jgi:hypothetical protein